MGNGRLATGGNIPEIVDDMGYVNVATADYSPIEDPSPSVPVSLDAYKGFLVRPQVDGDFYGITYRQWAKAGKPASLTGLIPVKVTLSANQFLECVYVKIFATNDATYKTTASPLNLGSIV